MMPTAIADSGVSTSLLTPPVPWSAVVLHFPLSLFLTLFFALGRTDLRPRRGQRWLVMRIPKFIEQSRREIKMVKKRSCKYKKNKLKSRWEISPGAKQYCISLQTGINENVYSESRTRKGSGKSTHAEWSSRESAFESMCSGKLSENSVIHLETQKEKEIGKLPENFIHPTVGKSTL